MLWWAESVKGSQEYLSGVIATLRMAGTTWARIAEYLGEPRRTVQDRYGWCDDLELLADMGLLEQLHDAVEDINSRRAPDDLRIPSPRVAS
jgi:hypothetical protein